MRITIFAAGSRGDIQPCIVLAMGLQAAGDDVCLAAPADFAPFAAEHGVPFRPLRGDVQQIMAGDTGREFMESGGGNPLKSIRAMRAMLGPIALQMAEDGFAACQDAEAIICLGVQGAFGATMAEALHRPLVHLEPAPLLPTRAFPPPAWPIQRNLGGTHNRLAGAAMLRVIWLWYGPFVNQFRARLGLPAMSAADFARHMRATPMVSAYSPAILPHPPDWPASVHVTGYLFLDDQTGWQPSAALQSFLDAGDPPIYIGFGSMAGRDPAALAALAIEALAASGQRGLLVTGWGGLRAGSVPANVFVLDGAPHSWLFPRMAAVVHHGGAGTTAEGLRAGVPTIIVPFAFDQTFWGARVAALGLGPAPIARKHLTAERLAAAITRAVSDRAMRERARAGGQRIRAEDGTGNAVTVVHHYFSVSRPPESEQSQ